MPVPMDFMLAAASAANQLLPDESAVFLKEKFPKVKLGGGLLSHTGEISVRFSVYSNDSEYRFSYLKNPLTKLYETTSQPLYCITDMQQEANTGKVIIHADQPKNWLPGNQSLLFPSPDEAKRFLALLCSYPEALEKQLQQDLPLNEKIAAYLHYTAQTGMLTELNSRLTRSTIYRYSISVVQPEGQYAFRICLSRYRTDEKSECIVGNRDSLDALMQFMKDPLCAELLTETVLEMQLRMDSHNE